jgi:hypothetical protein
VGRVCVWGGGYQVVVRGGGGGDVEASHISTGSFRANENGCRVSRGIDRKCCGGKKARARSLQEGGDGKERVG